MIATIELSSLAPEPAAMTIGVLERNRAVLQRATRVVRAAANFAWVAAEDQPSALRGRLAPQACSPRVNAVSLTAFMGLPCPMKSEGISTASGGSAASARALTSATMFAARRDRKRRRCMLMKSG